MTTHVSPGTTSRDAGARSCFEVLLDTHHPALGPFCRTSGMWTCLLQLPGVKRPTCERTRFGVYHVTAYLASGLNQRIQITAHLIIIRVVVCVVPQNSCQDAPVIRFLAHHLKAWSLLTTSNQLYNQRTELLSSSTCSYKLYELIKYSSFVKAWSWTHCMHSFQTYIPLLSTPFSSKSRSILVQIL